MFRLCCLIAMGALVSGCATTPARDDPRAQCLSTYKSELEACAAHHASQLAECDRLYGSTPKSVGDPNAYAKCVGDANSDYTNCITSAVQRYNNASALCPPAPSKPQ